MKFIYIDTETTGLDPIKDDIIQLAGIVSVDGVSEEFNFRIKPRPGNHITDAAYMAHLITDKEAQEYPPASEVLPQFMDILKKYINRYDKKDKFFFIAYSAVFDFDFLRNFFEINGEQYFGSWFYFPPLDVMQLAAFHLMGRRAELKNFQLATVYEELIGKPLENAHDAMADISATKEILNKIVANQKKL